MPASTSTVLQGIGEIKESALAISNVRVAIQDLKMLNRKPLVETSQLTPKNFFGNKTQREVKQLLEDKFGPPKSVRNYAETYYNQKTQRSFNVHKEPGHNEGKAHVDIRRRGGHQERKYDLFEDL